MLAGIVGTSGVFGILCVSEVRQGVVDVNKAKERAIARAKEKGLDRRIKWVWQE